MKRLAEVCDYDNTLLIDTSERNFLEVDIGSIVSSLTKKEKPIELSLCNHKLGDKKVAVLIDGLITTNTDILLLDLSENLITDKGVQSIAKFLESNSTLHSLYLCNNLFHDKGFLSISEALSSNSNLKELHLCGNYTSNFESEESSRSEDEGTLSLAYLMNTKLNEQNIEDKNEFQLTSVYQEAIKNILLKNETLAVLGISFNGLDDSDVSSISEALHDNKSLTDLDLEGNRLGANTGFSLIESLKINRTLLKLNLNDNQHIPRFLCDSISHKIERNNNLVKLLAKAISDEYFGTKFSNINLSNHSLLKYYQEVNKDALSLHVAKYSESQIEDVYPIFGKIDSYINNNYFSIIMVCNDISKSIGLNSDILSTIISNFGEYSLSCIGQDAIGIEDV